MQEYLDEKVKKYTIKRKASRMEERVTTTLAVAIVVGFFVLISVPITLLVNVMFYGAEISFFDTWITLILLVVVYNQIGNRVSNER